MSLLWRRGPCSGGSGVPGGSYRQVSSGESHGQWQAGEFAHHPYYTLYVGVPCAINQSGPPAACLLTPQPPGLLLKYAGLPVISCFAHFGGACVLAATLLSCRPASRTMTSWGRSTTASPAWTAAPLAAAACLTRRPRATHPACRQASTSSTIRGQHSSSMVGATVVCRCRQTLF